MISSCDGEVLSENPLTGRLEDHEFSGDRTTDKCKQCRRQMDAWHSYQTSVEDRLTQRCKSTPDTVRTTMFSRTLVSRTVFLWTLAILVTFCCGVQGAPEAFHRRQGDSPSVIPQAGLHDLEELGLTENNEQDAKHEEELAALIDDILRYKKEWQLQGIEDDANRQDSGALSAVESYPNLPIPLALQAKLFRSPDGVSKDENKRGSYQPPLCYFKICNMGKRNGP